MKNGVFLFVSFFFRIDNSTTDMIGATNNTIFSSNDTIFATNDSQQVETLTLGSREADTTITICSWVKVWIQKQG